MDTYCRGLDAHNNSSGLAKFYNANENDAVKYLNLQSEYYINGFTIGDTGKWYYYNGDDEVLESLKYTNWGEDQ